MAVDLTPRQRRWLDAILILATLALAYIVLGFAGSVFAAFGDVILVFFLAWLLAFILSPIVARILTLLPFLSRGVAVAIVYAVLFGGLIFLTVAIASALATSVADFIGSVPQLRNDLPSIIAPWQERLDSLGIGQVDLLSQARAFLDNLDRIAGELAGPLQQVAVASLGAIANLLLVVILSLYMVADRDRILSFLFRVVPPAFAADASLLEASVARSFGGFLRGQAIIGVMYAAIAAIASATFGLDYLAATSAVAGLLMAIPFFGPFAAWAPPVLVAIFAKPDAVLGTFVIMGVGWLIVMNAVTPRIMSNALRIHPIVVLGSVLVGAKVAGVPGAIFGIPIAAVLAAFFFHYLERTRDVGPVAARAAKRLEEREGRAVRMPREPRAGIDADVEGVSGVDGAEGVPGVEGESPAG
jgi:predicted PurR-regulated permease PerM